MASIKISELEEIVDIVDTDVLPIVNDGTTKKIAIEQLKNLLGDVTTEDITNITGKLENLSTEDKTNLVSAINEVFGLIGETGDIEGIQTLNETSYSGHLAVGIYKVTATTTTIYASINSGASYDYGTMIFVTHPYIPSTGNSYYMYTSLEYDATNGPQLRINYAHASSSQFITVTVPFKTIATTSYVDTAIANAITTVLEGEY